jgi:hypothetical protein
MAAIAIALTGGKAERTAVVGILEDDVDHPADRVGTVLRGSAIGEHLDPRDRGNRIRSRSTGFAPESVEVDRSLSAALWRRLPLTRTSTWAPQSAQARRAGHAVPRTGRNGLLVEAGQQGGERIAQRGIGPQPFKRRAVDHLDRRGLSMVVVALARLPVTTIPCPVPHRHRHLLAAMLASVGLLLAGAVSAASARFPDTPAPVTIVVASSA